MTVFVCKINAFKKITALFLALVTVITLSFVLSADSENKNLLSSKSDYIKWVNFGITLPVLKQAMKYYTSLSTFSADIGNITVRQMVLFIDTLILDGRKNAIAAGSDYNYRNTVLTSIAFLEAIKKELIGV